MNGSDRDLSDQDVARLLLRIASNREMLALFRRMRERFDEEVAASQRQP